MGYRKIIKITPLDDMLLLVKFETGESKILDMKPYMQMHKSFESLKDTKLFRSVRTEHFGRVIIWDKKIDIDGEEAWEFGQPVEE